MQHPSIRCDQECGGEGGDYTECQRWHTSEEHPEHGYCAVVSVLADTCNSCENMLSEWQIADEIRYRRQKEKGAQNGLEKKLV